MTGRREVHIAGGKFTVIIDGQRVYARSQAGALQQYNGSGLVRALGEEILALRGDDTFPSQRGFRQGVAYAAALIIRTYGKATIGADLIRQAGFTLRDLEDAGVDEYDLGPIRSAWGVERAT